jgi:hypothetical protein
LTSPGGVHSYCFLLRIDFDAIFGDLLFLKCLFSLYLFVLMLPLIFISVISLCNILGCGMWVTNFMVNVVAALIAYTWQPKKPSLRFDENEIETLPVLLA